MLFKSFSYFEFLFGRRVVGYNVSADGCGEKVVGGFGLYSLAVKRQD